MSAQSLENYNREGAGGQPGDVRLRERNTRLLPLQNVEILPRSRSFANSRQTRSSTWHGA
jgi:hypothetical protein